MMQPPVVGETFEVVNAQTGAKLFTPPTPFPILTWDKQEGSTQAFLEKSDRGYIVFSLNRNGQRLMRRKDSVFAYWQSVDASDMKREDWDGLFWQLPAV